MTWRGDPALAPAYPDRYLGLIIGVGVGLVAVALIVLYLLGFLDTFSNRYAL